VVAQAKDNSYGPIYIFLGDLKVTVALVINFLKRKSDMKLMNIVVYEQCDCPSSPYITEYIKIIDFLINTGKDVNILVEKKIIVNLLGDDDALATMVNNLCSNITMIHINSEYRSLCYQLNGFFGNPLDKI